MTIIGFNFTKMHIERKAPVAGKISVKNNVAVKDVEKKDFNFGKAAQAGLRFTFEFTVEYEPKIADILLEGEVIDLVDEKRADSIVKEWKKNKKIEPALMTNILNTVLSKSNVQALILSKDLNLPPPIPLPKVNVTPAQARTDAAGAPTQPEAKDAKDGAKEKDAKKK